MGGKSTYLRMVALCVLLAQVGSFVPAERARIGLVDRLFTRVGSEDDLAAGASTFLVEMAETASILRQATLRSLVVLDEVGRGTSTHDGLCIAQAVLEHLHDVIGARTLFATHFHELTALADSLSTVRNVTVAVDEKDGQLSFLYRVVPGAADRSYGVQVARLAGLLGDVTERAAALLREREADAWAVDPRPVSLGVLDVAASDPGLVTDSLSSGRAGAHEPLAPRPPLPCAGEGEPERGLESTLQLAVKEERPAYVHENGTSEPRDAQDDVDLVDPMALPDPVDLAPLPDPGDSIGSPSPSQWGVTSAQPMFAPRSGRGVGVASAALLVGHDLLDQPPPSSALTQGADEDTSAGSVPVAPSLADPSAAVPSREAPFRG